MLKKNQYSYSELNLRVHDRRMKNDQYHDTLTLRLGFLKGVKAYRALLCEIVIKNCTAGPGRLKIYNFDSGRADGGVTWRDYCTYTYCRVPECLSHRRNWVPLPPPPHARVAPPLDPKRGRKHSLADEVVGGLNLDDKIESLALCILCDV